MPGWFSSRYLPPGIGTPYKTLERLSPEEARQRRLFAELGRQRKVLEAQEARLSPANKFHLNKLKEFESKFQSALDARSRNVKEREKQFNFDKSLANFRRLKTARSVLVQLTQRRDALRKRATLEALANENTALYKFKAAAADRRSYTPPRLVPNPRTVFGTEAWTAVSEGSRRYFRNPLLAIPCVDRLVRREVMFAKKKAGKGHRVPHKRSLFSDIGC